MERLDGRRPDLAAGDPFSVRKIEYGSGRVVFTWHGTLVSIDARQIVVRATFAPSGRRVIVVDGVPFLAGDVFTEYYPLGRWYNIFHIADASGRVKGWYCNVTLPPILDGEGIAFTDMALDLFVHPDGRATVLDEDEFAVGCGVYRHADALGARRGLKALQRIALDRALPSPPRDH